MSAASERGPMRPAGGFGPGRGGPMSGLAGPVERSRNFGPTVRRIAGRLAPERRGLLLVVLLGVVSVGLTVLGPKLLGNATTLVFEGVVGGTLPPGLTQAEAETALRAQGEDQLADMLTGMTVTPGEGVDFTAVGSVLAVTALVYLLASLFAWAQAYLVAGVVQRTMFRLRADVEATLGRLPLGYYDRSARGDVISRVTNDLDNLATTLQQVASQLLTSVLTVVGVLGMMLWISPLLALVSLLLVPVSFVVTLLIARRSQPHFVAQWEHTGDLNAHVEQTCTGHDVVKLFGRQDAAVAEFDAVNGPLYHASARAQFISGIIQPAMMFIGNVNYVVIAVVGGLRVASGSMTLGDVQAFIQYSRQFTMPITQIASVVNLMQSGAASAERVFEVLDVEPESPDPADAVRPAAVRGRVTFEGVSFRYRPDRPLIDDLDLVVEPGDTVAIVGPTGAGKTTLVNLLLRFYDVDRGRITLDGVDTRRLRRDDLRGAVAMVLQDTWLFGGTIRDNIAYGAPAAGEDQVLAAARAAHVDHFVRTLPDGYDTVLADESAALSAGERQLVTIARAFLADRPILVLDEATSSVDTRTEVLIQRAMARLRAGRTSFVIAHRLSTIRDASTILVLEQGRIVERGDHETLLAAEGAYADLYASQFLAQT